MSYDMKNDQYVRENDIGINHKQQAFYKFTDSRAVLRGIWGY